MFHVFHIRLMLSWICSAGVIVLVVLLYCLWCQLNLKKFLQEQRLHSEREIWVILWRQSGDQITGNICPFTWLPLKMSLVVTYFVYPFPHGVLNGICNWIEFLGFYFLFSLYFSLGFIIHLWNWESSFHTAIIMCDIVHWVLKLLLTIHLLLLLIFLADTINKSSITLKDDVAAV